MTPSQARQAAESVWRYVERTAIREPGSCRWPTLDYENQPQTNAPTIFNGAAGIAVFLLDYAVETNTPKALELAGDALRWSEVAARPLGAGFSFGMGGIGWAWLRHAKATGTREGVERATAIGAEVVTDALAPGEWGICTDTMGGVAGKGEVCLALYGATLDQRWLGTAGSYGAWFDEHKLVTEWGAAWPMMVGGSNPRVFWGGAHGIAGIVRFLVRLHRATSEPRWLRLAADAGRTLERAAVEIHGGLNWPRGPGMPELKCQWCHGAPGVGLVFTDLFAATGETAWLDLAARAGRAVVGYGDARKNPSWCHGLMGNAELLLELFRLTKDERWMKDALAFGRLALAYRTEDADGERWQADDPPGCSPDFMCGASGAGHVFLRMASAGRLPMALP